MKTLPRLPDMLLEDGRALADRVANFCGKDVGNGVQAGNHLCNWGDLPSNYNDMLSSRINLMMG